MSFSKMLCQFLSACCISSQSKISDKTDEFLVKLQQFIFGSTFWLGTVHVYMYTVYCYALCMYVLTLLA